MSEPPSEDTSSFLREDPEGILCFAIEGDISDPMARSIAAVFRRVSDSGRELFVLSDARRVGTLTAGARSALAEELRGLRFSGVAVFGASFSLRVVITLASRSVQFFTGEAYPLAFFDTEDDARAWLLAQREEIRATRRIQP
ncbi:STAS/SEC14 domain-containing protein [Sorangium sp. So ce1000]|uniref:STAS/SEC14 domain-containing protein n=1 Tax=Sorangium sp. So ce1000 TaxID=3133325 RepID=UPI003F62E3FA